MDDNAIKPKDDDEEQGVLDPRSSDLRVISDPRADADNQSYVNVSDGVSFTVGGGQSFPNDNSSSTADTDGLPSMAIFSNRSSYYPQHQPANRFDSGHGWLNLDFSSSSNYQPNLPTMNESSGYGAQQYDNSQSLGHRYGRHSMRDVGVEIRNDASSEPSTSTAARPPENLDDLSIYTNRILPTGRRRVKHKADDIQCRICFLPCSSECKRFSNAEKHAVMHQIESKRGRFPCPLCKYTNCWKYGVKKHFKEHQTNSHPPLPEWLEVLTPVEETEWVGHVNRCFPDVNDRGLVVVKKRKREPLKKKMCRHADCNMPITQSSLIFRRHVLSKHLNHFIYKCTYPGCTTDFETKSYCGIVRHRTGAHRIEIMKEAEVKLTKNQEEEVAAMIKHCFPDEE